MQWAYQVHLFPFLPLPLSLRLTLLDKQDAVVAGYIPEDLSTLNRSVCHAYT